MALARFCIENVWQVNVRHALFLKNARWRIYLCLHCGKCLRFVVFRRFLFTVFTCFRQVCKRCPFTVQKDTFQKAESHVLYAERTPLEIVNIAVPLQKLSPTDAYMWFVHFLIVLFLSFVCLALQAVLRFVSSFLLRNSTLCWTVCPARRACHVWKQLKNTLVRYKQPTFAWSCFFVLRYKVYADPAVKI